MVGNFHLEKHFKSLKKNINKNFFYFLSHYAIQVLHYWQFDLMAVLKQS